MSDSGQRTEQPTPRRLEKAREEGQFPVSKEFVSGVVFLCFAWLLESQSGALLEGGRRLVRESLAMAFGAPPTPAGIEHWLMAFVTNRMLWLLAAGLLLSLVAVAVHLVSSGLAFAPSKLMPDLTRLNPAPRLKELPSQNGTNFVMALLLLPIFGWLLWQYLRSHWGEFVALPRLPLPSAVLFAGDSLSGLVWKAGTVLFLLGAFDLYRQRRRWMERLRMSKHEIREEQKETDGNPLIKGRIRRLQREALRRRMMQQVSSATAVVVNPTHYSVAIRYQMERGGAPLVVAKGKNWLALRIREKAIRNQIPIIENPPLARALYSSVDVGKEIPPHLYQAVAEVLAYVYRLAGGRLGGREA